jgi:hypothetical protein
VAALGQVGLKVDVSDDAEFGGQLLAVELELLLDVVEDDLLRDAVENELATGR